MKETATGPYVDVKDLRLGMFVHLELGWMAHPFPLSSFRLTGLEQIDTIRTLGIERLRWSPEKSAGETAPVALPGASERNGAASHTQPAQFDQVAAVSAIETAEAAARRQRKRALGAQRDAVRQCEAQLGEATREFKRAYEMVHTLPQQARQQTEALAGALLAKMAGERDMSIRLLSESAGDKASMHALNTTVISLLMGRVFGMADEELLDLGVGSLMHDVGKLELPERVRYRDDHFSAAELQFYQDHVQHGVTAGRRMGLKPGALLVIAQHHEHTDGSGFPMKLNSDRLSMASRIVALVNRYDNLCNPNLPSKALTPHESLSLLFAQGRDKYDTAIMGAFIKMMGVYPPGSAVQLTDDRYALVTSVNSSRPLKPRVLVHDPRVPQDEALLLDLEKSPALGIRRAVKPLQLPRDALEYLSPRPRVVYFFEPARELETVEIAA